MPFIIATVQQQTTLHPWPSFFAHTGPKVPASYPVATMYDKLRYIHNVYLSHYNHCQGTASCVAPTKLIYPVSHCCHETPMLLISGMLDYIKLPGKTWLHYCSEAMKSLVLVSQSFCIATMAVNCAPAHAITCAAPLKSRAFGLIYARATLNRKLSSPNIACFHLKIGF